MSDISTSDISTRYVVIDTLNNERHSITNSQVYAILQGDDYLKDSEAILDLLQGTITFSNLSSKPLKQLSTRYMVFNPLWVYPRRVTDDYALKILNSEVLLPSGVGLIDVEQGIFVNYRLEQQTFLLIYTP